MISNAVMAPYHPHADAPQWFLDNLRQPGESLLTEVDGRNVHMLTWNWDRTDLPALLLVHGFGAHCRWWSFLAPFFLDRYRVAALDLPGMGDSEPPAHYHERCFAQAILTCIEVHRLAPVCIIGHSFGGAQSLRAMAIAPELFSRGIVVDSNYRMPEEPPIRRLLPKGEHKTSPTHAECIARMRLVPPQPNYIEALVHYVAFHSCKPGTDGWHWKSDPNCLNVGEIEECALFQSIERPVDLIYGAQSFLNIHNKPQRLLALLPPGGELLMIPEAGHHIMADYPLELVAAINKLLKTKR